MSIALRWADRRKSGSRAEILAVVSGMFSLVDMLDTAATVRILELELFVTYGHSTMQKMHPH